METKYDMKGLTGRAIVVYYPSQLSPRILAANELTLTEFEFHPNLTICPRGVNYGK